MKQQILNIAKIIIFLFLAISIAIPKIAAVSFCNPMDQVMLQSCCHSKKPEIKNGDDSISAPACCDQISLPDADKDLVSVVSLPKPVTLSAWFQLPEPEWILLEAAEDPQPAQARGPPPDLVPLFIQNCSYLI